jgi:hypothetical protein
MNPLSSVPAKSKADDGAFWRWSSYVATAALLGACLSSSGCGPDSPGLPRLAPAAFSGRVVGGQNPISGSLIQLYAIGTTGDGSPATPLIANTITSSDGTGASNNNANPGNLSNSLPPGSFTITGNYTCPSQATQVYLVARGGNPGLPSGAVNPQIALMAALGDCGSLNPATQVVLNELTTIGSIAPLFPFMNSYASLGASPADMAQLLAALAEVPEYTDVFKGTVPGPTLPPGYYASSREILTLGDVIAACVNSTGGVAGTAGVCGQFFQMAAPQGGAPPDDTIQAVLDILKNPTSNVAPIFNLRSPAAPFRPALVTPPPMWSLPITLLPTTFSTTLNNTSFFTGASIISYWPLPMHKDGIPGETSSQVLARFSADVLNHGYARVIILCGTNDILLNTPNLAVELPANLQAMAAMATNAGVEVVLSELPPATSNGVDMNAAVNVANAAILQLAAQHGYLVVDYNTPLTGHPEDFVDGIHPTAAGYAVMEKALSAVVMN